MIDNKYLFRLTNVGGPRDVIAAGPLTKQRMSVPYRIELCDLGDDGFVVCYHHVSIGDHGVISHHRYGGGRYFSSEQLKDALACFGRWMVDDAEHVSSILSDQEKQHSETAAASVPPSVPGEDAGPDINE